MQNVSNFEYSQGDLLGHGAFALVFKGRRKKDHLPVAIKQIALKSVPGKFSSIRQKEIDILKDLKNTHIVQLYDYQETSANIFLIMEYCNGGDLGDYLIAKKTLSESSIRHLCKHMAAALQGLVQLQIIHRDIKPQNLLLSYPPSSSSPSSNNSIRSHFSNSIIKLADFGFARYLTGADMAATLCGSPLYMAPEILMGQRYDSLVDLWSMGTILYQCLSGSAPFLASNPHALRRRYEREKLIPKIPDGTSHHLRDLLLKLLKRSPSERLSYSDFFQHDFLKDPSSFPSDPMLTTFCPSQAVKSSPVPIKRQPHPPHSSHRQSISPHRGSSVDVSSFSPSSFSGPPLSHRVGSQASLQYYSAQSPNTDVTDQGFVLVDFPGGSNSRRASVSSSGGGHASGRSSGRNSAPGHALTPSSASGSLSRYSSLMTPFYQPQSRGARGECQDIAVTPVGKRLESPAQYNFGTNFYVSPGPTHHGANYYHSSISTVTGPSPPGVVPFGQLIPSQHPIGAASNFSNVSSNYGHSHHNRTPPASAASPLSTPPSLSSPGAHASHIKGTLARRNSGTKLSALAEERETRKGGKNHSAANPTAAEKAGSGGFDVITQSYLLGFSEDEDGGLEVVEDNFPVDLTTSVNSNLSNEQENSDTGKELDAPRLTHPVLLSSGNALHFAAGSDVVHFTAAGLTHPRLSSGSQRDQQSSSSAASRPRRAASFSHQRNPQLSQQLAALHTQASSLDAHGDPFDPSTTPLMTTSPSAVIIPFRPPFVFLGPNSTAVRGGALDASSRGGKGSRRGEGGYNGTVCFGSLKLSDMVRSLTVVEELHGMAKARQGPILLMSTSALNDSGIAGRRRRCLEQVVLFAKALNLLDSLFTSYGMEVAMAANEEPPEQMMKVVERATSLQDSCLLEAKQLRQEMLSDKENGWNSEIQDKVSAERLLFLEALDMCKAALLDERSEEALECVKRYRRAKLIFEHLLLEARTHNDKLILQKYTQSVQARISHLLS